jgi:hypothetical protein
MVLVDTEEEFDWTRPLARENTCVTAMAAQHRAHRIFEKYDIKPTYVVDYPVAGTPEGSAPLRELFDDSLCEIGAHLHPWVNPPFEEDVNNFNSYPGNLPPALEREKLLRLTRTIEDRFGFHPTIYKAGRYGVGAATTSILEELGYMIDTSVVPGTDFRADEGPDFSHCGAKPYWFGKQRRLLEIPLSAGFTGAAARVGGSLYGWIASDAGKAAHLPGILARLRFLDRVILTPEGITHAEHRRLTGKMLSSGHRVFSFTYHSPSLEPGFTPYVQTTGQLHGFLDRMERYFDYFMGEVGGRPATPYEILERLSQPQTTAASRGQGPEARVPSDTAGTTL